MRAAQIKVILILSPLVPGLVFSPFTSVQNLRLIRDWEAEGFFVAITTTAAPAGSADFPTRILDGVRAALAQRDAQPRLVLGLYLLAGGIGQYVHLFRP